MIVATHNTPEINVTCWISKTTLAPVGLDVCAMEVANPTELVNALVFVENNFSEGTIGPKLPTCNDLEVLISKHGER